MTNNRIFYLWLLLITGIFLIAVFHDSSRMHSAAAFYDSNRWFHFLAYASVVAIPVTVSRRGTSLLFTFIPVIVCIAIESSQSSSSWTMVHTQMIPADLFGVAAGILLGLNLRTMRGSTQSLNDLRSDRSHTATT